MKTKILIPLLFVVLQSHAQIEGYWKGKINFSEQEVADALALGFIPVSLGNSRLRTETAGVVACHTAILMNE